MNQIELSKKVRSIVGNPLSTPFKIGKTNNTKQRLQNYHSDDEELDYVYIQELCKGSPEKITMLEKELIEFFLKSDPNGMCQNKDSRSSGNSDATILYVVYHTVESLKEEILTWLDENKVMKFKLCTFTASNTNSDYDYIAKKCNELSRVSTSLLNRTLRELVEKLSKHEKFSNHTQEIDDKHDSLVVCKVDVNLGLEKS